VHVALILVAMIAFSALTIDLGAMFVSRRQVQNAADAAALAASLSLSYVNSTDVTLARNSAISAAQQNLVWGQQPDILATDVTVLGACPAGAPGVGPCVQANVFRTSYQRANGSPLPTFFAQIVGVNEQGVRATATAQLQAGTGTADCVKPVAVPDRWIENRPVPAQWTNSSTFERYEQNGNNKGALLTPADDYVPPTTNSLGSGFTVQNDYGTELILKEGNPHDAIDPGFFYPIVIDPTCVGGNCYRDAWEGCSAVPIGPGTVLNPEPGNMIGPTRQGVTTLINQDPTASWSTAANGGRGGPVGGCMAAGTCGRSPRWVAIPLFDVKAYDQARTLENQNGRTVPITIVKVIGFWLDRIQGNNVYGRIMYYPTTSFTGPPIPGGGMFASTIILVR
jgi:hypothetical protein